MAEHRSPVACLRQVEDLRGKERCHSTAVILTRLAVAGLLRGATHDLKEICLLKAWCAMHSGVSLRESYLKRGIAYVADGYERGCISSLGERSSGCVNPVQSSVEDFSGPSVQGLMALTQPLGTTPAASFTIGFGTDFASAHVVGVSGVAMLKGGEVTTSDARQATILGPCCSTDFTTALVVGVAVQAMGLGWITFATTFVTRG